MPEPPIVRQYSQNFEYVFVPYYEESAKWKLQQVFTSCEETIECAVQDRTLVGAIGCYILIEVEDEEGQLHPVHQVYCLRSMEPITDFHQMEIKKCEPLKVPQISKHVTREWHLYYDIETVGTEPDIDEKILPEIYLIYLQLVEYDYWMQTDELIEEAVVNSARDFVEKLFSWVNLMSTYEGEFNWNANKSKRFVVLGYNSAKFDHIFLMEEYMRRLHQENKLSKMMPMVKAGKVIGATCKIHNIEVKWSDVMFYIGAPETLRKTAIGWGVEQKKGYFPMKVLIENRVCDSRESLVDKETGYYKEELFMSHQEYVEALEAFQLRPLEVLNLKQKKLAGEFITAGQKRLLTRYEASYQETGSYLVDVYTECLLYCEDDVISTRGIFKKLHEAMIGLIWEGLNLKVGRLSDFQGSPALMKAVALNNAYVEVLDPKGKQLYVCQSRYNAMVVKSLYGGMCFTHFQGEFLNKDLVMIDIVSHYPCSFTGWMPVGPAKALPMMQAQYLVDNIRGFDLNTLPHFIVECEAIPRVGGSNLWISSLPYKKTKETSFDGSKDPVLIWGAVKSLGVWNSMDIWTASKYDGWRFTVLDDGLAWSDKEILFRKFVDTLAVMKAAGKREKNAAKTNAAKVALNSTIGKMGERPEVSINEIFTDDDLMETRLNILESDGFNKITSIVPIHLDDVEGHIVHGKRLRYNNKIIPNQIASFMYSASRVIRVEMAYAVQCSNPLSPDYCYNLQQSKSDNYFPEIIYGDTDSILISEDGWERMKLNIPGVEGKEIGGYDVNTAKYVFNVEVELRNINYGIILGLKKYYLVDTKSSGFPSKQGCNGFRLLKRSGECPIHKGVLLSDCRNRLCWCVVKQTSSYFCYHCLRKKSFQMREDVFYSSRKRDRIGGSDKRWHHPYQPFVITDPDKKLNISTIEIWPLHYLLALGGTDVITVQEHNLAHTTSKKVGQIDPYTVYVTRKEIKFSKPSLARKCHTDYSPIIYPLSMYTYM